MHDMPRTNTYATTHSLHRWLQMVSISLQQLSSSYLSQPVCLLIWSYSALSLHIMKCLSLQTGIVTVARNTSACAEEAGSKEVILTLQRCITFLWKWSNKDSLTIMEIEGVASKKMLVKLSHSCRDLWWQALLLHPIPQLGGPGVIVQIEESMFSHK